MEARRFSIKQIAAQAAVSPATVDRAVHQRGHVSRETALRIRRAIDELEQQAAAGLPFGLGRHVDVVMQAPRRFSDAVTRAFTTAASGFAPMRVAPRFHCDERMTADAMAARLTRIARRDTAGIVLKAPQSDVIVDTVASVVEGGIPVVTWVTDLAASRRLAYIGPDNHGAGRTAAFLLGRFLGDGPATVLAHVGSDRFLGEDERRRGFKALMAEHFPGIVIHEMSGGFGLDRATRRLAVQALDACGPVDGVYSMGGGNRGILQAFDEAGQRLRAFVGHDLDAENRALLQTGRLDAVVDHDLRADAREALSLIVRHHAGLAPASERSRVVIVTPWNV